MHRHLDRRITAADRLADLPVRDHARRHIAECLRLGKLPQLSELRLAAWAHMLGFRGHFSTKSRAYSTTMDALRADRAAYQREDAIAAGLLPDLDSDITLVINDWHFAGRGHQPPIAAPRLTSHLTRRRWEVRHEPAPADRARGGRSVRHLSQQALRDMASGAIASIRIDGSRRIPLIALEEYVSRLLSERSAA